MEVGRWEFKVWQEILKKYLGNAARKASSHWCSLGKRKFLRAFARPVHFLPYKSNPRSPSAMIHHFRHLFSLGCLAAALAVYPAAASAQVPKNLQLALNLDGGITITPADNGRVQIKADMAGVGRHLGLSKAEAVWFAPQTVIADLASGVIQEANIGAGTLIATIANGSSVSGTFNGRLVRLASGRIGHESAFVITGGTGHFAGSSGSGFMRGTADTQSLRFHLDIKGSLLWKPGKTARMRR